MSRSILLILTGIFYSVLCLFSIVTGQMYASGKKELNPLELSDNFVAKLNEKEKLLKFTKRMGWVTFFVGIVQGISAYCALVGNKPVHYYILLGFTIFSILSAATKLKKKINFFPMMKLVFYIAIYVVCLLSSTKSIYF